MTPSALLVIDMQNAYCHPNGELAAIAPDPNACARVIDPCMRAIAAARKAAIPVLHAVKLGLSDEVPTVSFHAHPPRFPHALRRGSWSAAIVDPLTPAPGEIVVEKLGFSAFFNTPLAIILRRLAVRELVLVGVTTSICVESTARDAVQHGHEVCVVADATAEWDRRRHERALEQIAYAFGRVVHLDELVSAWGSA